MVSKDGQASTKNIELNEFMVRGGLAQYKSIKLVTCITLIVTVLSDEFSIPISWRVSHII